MSEEPVKMPEPIFPPFDPCEEILILSKKNGQWQVVKQAAPPFPGLLCLIPADALA